MSKVVLHIGTHKTATTAIQDTFWANAELLAEHGVIYPQLGRHTGHHGLAHDWVKLAPPYKLPGGSEAALQDIAATYADKDVTVFLSSEEFSRGNPERTMDFVRLRELLSDFDEIEVVCTLRTQWQFLQSVYLEMSRTHIPPRPPHLVDPVIRTGMFEGLYVDYNLLLDRLLEVFDSTQIRLFDFDTIRATPGGVLGHFLRYLGVETDDLELVNQGVSNVSPMSLASWSANILSEPRVAPPWLVTKASATLKEQYGDSVRPCLFIREEFVRLGDHFDARNEVLRLRCVDVQPDFAIAKASNAGLNLFRNEIHGAFWLRMGRSMARDRMTGKG